MPVINFTASPTCALFMKNDSFGRLIAGPVGSGKTTACIFETLRRSCEQAPSYDGFRYTRFAILRQTLKQLKDTVLKDILGVLKGVASYKVSDNTIYVSVGDVRSEWLLIPLEDPDDQRRLLSMQLTGSWMSEGIEMDVDLVAAVSGRCGRYPSAVMGGCTWKGIIVDTNMPTEQSPWHKFMTTEVSPDWKIFIQPGGLKPDAENLEWLEQTADTLKLPLTDQKGDVIAANLEVRKAQGRKYYERAARNKNLDWVKRYVHAQYGDDPSGTAVYRESFKRSFHVVKNLTPVPGHILIVGQDFGRDPCSIICQVDHKGRLLVLAEVLAEDIGLELHIQRSLRPAMMDPRYFGRAVGLVGDPAGVAKDCISEETPFDVLKRAGFSAFPAPTNDIDARIRSVDSFLLAQRDGGPAIVFDEDRCPMLIRAMSGGYRYARTKQGQRKPKPDKNEFSHVVDALQYACLVCHGGMAESMARQLNRTRVSKRPRISAGAWT